MSSLTLVTSNPAQPNPAQIQKRGGKNKQICSFSPDIKIFTLSSVSSVPISMCWCPLSVSMRWCLFVCLFGCVDTSASLPPFLTPFLSPYLLLSVSTSLPSTLSSSLPPSPGGSLPSSFPGHNPTMAQRRGAGAYQAQRDAHQPRGLAWPGRGLRAPGGRACRCRRRHETPCAPVEGENVLGRAGIARSHAKLQ